MTEKDAQGSMKGDVRMAEAAGWVFGGVMLVALLVSRFAFKKSQGRESRSIDKQVVLQSDLPFPPMELRRIVGPTEDEAYDNPDGSFVFGDLGIGPLEAGEAYRRVFDFGCGCGRNARQLLLQQRPPEQYVGIDVGIGMIKWCQRNLSPPKSNFSFHHHDVWSQTYAPGNTRGNSVLPLTEFGRDFTLINAHSVFTHLYEHQTLFYLDQCRDLLAERGIFRTTWFFFNRDWFPVLNPGQHCVYVNSDDPTQAVYYDWSFFAETIEGLGFKIVGVGWHPTPGYQHEVLLAKGPEFPNLMPQLELSPNVLGFGGSAPPPLLQDREFIYA
ncbi:MAG: class I SAM-dependent methyltransferase [bacterium]|nr:class I SAM-dependent methyltransferase [bacterium]